MMLGASKKGGEVASKLGPWRLEPSDTTWTLVRSHFVNLGTYLYMFGGYDGRYSVDYGLRATVDPEGTVSTFQAVSTNDLKYKYDSGVVVKTDTRVYILGGMDGTVGNFMYYANILPTGMLSGWVLDPIRLPIKLGSSTAVTVGGRVYLLGGYNVSTDKRIKSIFSAPILPDGSLGSWVTEPNTLPSEVYSAPSIVTDTHVYMFGGQGNLGSTSSIVYSPILEDGTLGTWSYAPMSLPEGLYGHSAIKVGDRAFLLGGQRPTGISNEVLGFEIDQNGLLSQLYIEEHLLPNKHLDSCVTVVGDRLYMLAGYQNGTASRSISSALILP